MLVLLPRVMAMVNFFMRPPRTEDGRSIKTLMKGERWGGANNKRRNTLFCVHPQIPISVCIFCITLCVIIHPHSSTHHLSMVEKKVVWFCVGGTRVA